MAEKRKRGQNYTAEEKERLVNLLSECKDTILNKKTDGCTNEAKNIAWITLTNKFNSSGNTHRSKDSLMKLWEKIKSDAKLYSGANRVNNTKTGGGNATIKIDPILEHVSYILGRSCTGIENVNDSDAIPCNEREVVVGTDCQPILYDVSLVDHEKNIQLQVSNKHMEETELQPNNFDFDSIQTPVCTDNQVTIPEVEPAIDQTINQTPLWVRRRRPQINKENERAEAVTSMFDTYKQVNGQRLDVESLKKQLLEEELNFKKKLYQLQLQTAQKELQIKTEILSQIKDGSSVLKNYASVQNE